MLAGFEALAKPKREGDLDSRALDSADRPLGPLPRIVGVSTTDEPRSVERMLSRLRASEAGGDIDRTLQRLDFGGGPLGDIGRRSAAISREAARIDLFMLYLFVPSTVDVDGRRFFLKLDSESESLFMSLGGGAAFALGCILAAAAEEGRPPPPM